MVLILPHSACKLISFNTIGRVHHDYMSPGSWSAISINSTKCRQIFMYWRQTVPQVLKRSTLINSTSTYRLPYFLTQISPLVGTSAQIDWALQRTKSSSVWGWCKFLVLHVRAYVSYYENALFLSSSHCTVNIGQFTIPTRWSFLRNLQIPINSQAFSLGNVQWLSHFLEYPSPQIISENNAFPYFHVFVLRLEFPWFLSEIVLFVAVFLV